MQFAADKMPALPGGHRGAGRDDSEEGVEMTAGYRDLTTVCAAAALALGLAACGGGGGSKKSGMPAPMEKTGKSRMERALALAAAVEAAKTTGAGRDVR